MSSFVLLTRYGPPDLIVEVGTPISKDPVMLSGLFQAIISFTDEVAQAPLQVLQTKGFTVQFKQMDNDYRLIVGTNHTIVGLDLILDQISELVKNGFDNDLPAEVIEQAIKEVLHNYVEFAQIGNEELNDLEKIPPSVQSMLDDIPPHTYEILFYGLLSGFTVRYPKTESMDLNRNLVKFMEFIEQKCCSDLDPDCIDTLTLISKSDKFKLLNNEYSRRDLTRTKLIKDLLDLIKKGNYMELKIKIQSEIGTLNQLEDIFMEFDINDHSEEEQERIDNLRYLIGSELEYFLLLRLQRKSKPLVEYLQKNTKQTEWMSSW